MSIIQTAEINMPSDPATLKKIKDVFQELSGAMIRIESEKEYIKEALTELSKDVDVPKKFMSKCLRIYHKSARNEVEAEQESTIELYDRIFGAADQQ